jgi:hypothetical protein
LSCRWGWPAAAARRPGSVHHSSPCCRNVTQQEKPAKINH